MECGLWDGSFRPYVGRFGRLGISPKADANFFRFGCG